MERTVVVVVNDDNNPIVAAGEEEHCAPIFLVGSHKDKIDDPEAHRKISLLLQRCTL